jgi:hypothetical protein
MMTNDKDILKNHIIRKQTKLVKDFIEPFLMGTSINNVVEWMLVSKEFECFITKFRDEIFITCEYGSWWGIKNDKQINRDKEFIRFLKKKAND